MNYPLLLNYPYQDLYRKQVVKQADLVLAMYLRGDAFTPEQKNRNYDYNESLTVRDSSMSACAQTGIAAEVGYLDLAFDYLVEAALTDLHDLHQNSSSGLHIASLAGTWLCCVAGFGGMRDHHGTISFAPRLPSRLNRMVFRLAVGTGCIEVQIDADEATYQLVHGDKMELVHHGEAFVLNDEPITLAIPPTRAGEPPTQPVGREPYRRSSTV